MRVFLTVALLVTAVLTATTVHSSSSHPNYHNNNNKKIIFVSCHSLKPPLDETPSPLWEPMTNRKPDVFIWGGDNVYADRMEFSLWKLFTEWRLPFTAGNETDISREYRKLHNLTPYQKLLQSGPDVLAVYDDHGDFLVQCRARSSLLPPR